jgi:hypothetical protein
MWRDTEEIIISSENKSNIELLFNQIKNQCVYNQRGSRPEIG